MPDQQYVLGDPNKKKPEIGGNPQYALGNGQYPAAGATIGNPQYTLGNGTAPGGPPPPPSVPGRQFPQETQVEMPAAGTQHVLGNGQHPAAGASIGNPQYPLGNGQPPAAGAGVGGSAAFPSLPPGAVPPPGYVDPITGKTAGAAPAPAPPGAPAAPAAGSNPFPSLPPGATPPPGYVDPVSGASAPAAGTPAAPATPAPATPAAPGSAAPGSAPTTIADAFKQGLVDTLNRGGLTPTLNDPTIKAQSDAYAVGQTRAREQAQAAMAERFAQQGLSNSGAADQGLAGLYQAQGESIAGNNARLVGDEATRRRQELLQGLAIAGNTLNAEQARAAQKELAELDAAIRREGIASQASIAGGDLALRSRLGEGQLNLGLLGLLTGDRYNRDALSQQGALALNGLDTSAILGLIGGLG